MKFNAKAGGDFEIAPEGTHIAVCNAIVDVGMQQTPMFGAKHQVYLRFELPGERVKFNKDGIDIEGPMTVGSFYTASMSEKANLRKSIESWFGKRFQSDDAAADFDLALLAGRACQVTIVHKNKGDKTYANIAGIVGLPKGMEPPKAENPIIIYPDKSALNDLPEWLQQKIGGAVTEDDSYEELAQQTNGFDDDIPGFD